MSVQEMLKFVVLVINVDLDLTGKRTKKIQLVFTLSNLILLVE